MTVLLAAEKLGETYRRQALIRNHAPRQVLFDINLHINAGESLAILGRSGSGKSTLLRQLLGVETPSEGRVLFEGRDLATMKQSGWQDLRRSVQMVFQDSIGAVSPRQTIGHIIAEPLRHLTSLSAADRGRRVEELLVSVGLNPSDALKRPGQMSGGQLQQVARDRGMIVFIAIHDLNQAMRFADKTIVIERGSLKGVGPTSEVITTQLLRDVYRIDARIEPCSHGHLQIVVDSVAGPATLPAGGVARAA